MSLELANYERAAWSLVMEQAARGLLPEPELHVDEWSEEFMVLPKSAARPGPYVIDRTPPVRRILQCLSPRHPARRVVVRGASQYLKTQAAINAISAWMHRAPGNILALEPTDSLVKRLSARITQTIKDVPVLRQVVAPARSRDARNTTHAKDFEGGTLYIATAGAAANLAEIPARYVVLDEVDRLDLSVQGEGDPVEMAEARATTFQNSCKFLEVSSPTLVGASKIDQLYEMGTQEYFAVPCPHCGHMHELVIENFHYEREHDDEGHMVRAWFVCPSCGVEIEERHKQAMVTAGDWIARSRGDGETVSFAINAFPMLAGSITWLTLARQHDRAKHRLLAGDDNAMKVFYNTRLALSWENTLERTTAKELEERAENYPPRIVPDRALVVTISVDTQPSRLEVQAEAWGEGMEHWVLDYQVLMGSPTESPDSRTSVWARLDQYRRTPFAHASGVLIPASVYGIDSGGANTQDVYNYGSQRAQLGCLILKGASKPNRPIISNTPSKVDIDHEGTRVPGGALLWMIGTDVSKDHIVNRWKITEGPGAMHWHQHMPREWFEGLLSEKPVLKLTPRGYTQRVWHKTQGVANEPLDLTVYNLALAHHLGLHKWSAQDWARLRERLVPANRTADMFVDLAIAESPPAATSTPQAPEGRRTLSRGVQ